MAYMNDRDLAHEIVARVQADPKCMKSTAAFCAKVETALVSYHSQRVVGHKLGERLAALLNKWESANPPVSDAELNELIATLPVISGFMYGAGMRPLARLYVGDVTHMEECRAARGLKP